MIAFGLMRAPIDVAIQPISAEDLFAAESYDTCICDECLCVIALDPRSNGANPHGTPNELIRISCPQCGGVKDYSVHVRRIRKYPWSVEPDSV